MSAALLDPRERVLRDSRELRLVDLDRALAATISPAPRVSIVPSLPPSGRVTLHPSCVRTTETPPTQRSATVHPHFDAAARHDARNMLAVMRLNVDFLASLLGNHSSALAADALEDIHQSLNRLERRFG